MLHEESGFAATWMEHYLVRITLVRVDMEGDDGREPAVDLAVSPEWKRTGYEFFPFSAWQAGAWLRETRIQPQYPEPEPSMDSTRAGAWQVCQCCDGCVTVNRSAHMPLELWSSLSWKTMGGTAQCGCCTNSASRRPRPMSMSPMPCAASGVCVGLFWSDDHRGE